MSSDALIRDFSGLSTTVIGDNLDRLRGAVGLRPLHGSKSVVGRAFTVQTRPGDNLFVHLSLDLAKPGDIIVVDGGGLETGALIGEIMMRYAQSKGIAGFVIDGALRDAAAFIEAEFPCFARSTSNRGPHKNGPGTVRQPISVGGMPVQQGDIIVGDVDGVVAIRPDEAEHVLKQSTQQLVKERQLLEDIAEGRFDRRWLAELIELHGER